jgi:GH24 family phage-related lysozyme (muramidase)
MMDTATMPHSAVLPGSLPYALRAGAALALVVCASCDRAAPPAASGKRPDSIVDSRRLGPKAARPGKNRMSSSGLERIRESESFSPRTYDDGVGNHTIGYGHMLRHGESFPGGITESRALELFADDVSAIADHALDQVTVPLTQNQTDALGSFIFNVGPGNFARSVLPALNAGDFERATNHMARFTQGRNQRNGELTVLRGLARRRREEIALFNAPPGTTALSSPGPYWSRVARRLLATVRHSSSA